MPHPGFSSRSRFRFRFITYPLLAGALIAGVTSAPTLANAADKHERDSTRHERANSWTDWWLSWFDGSTEWGSTEGGTSGGSAAGGSASGGSTSGGSTSGGSTSGGSTSGGSTSGGTTTIRPGETDFGSAIHRQGGESAAQAHDRVSQTYGGALGAARVFFPGLPASWSQLQSNYDDTPLVVSFKAKPQEVNAGKYDDFFRTWFAAAPTDRVTRWSYWHEPEDNASAGEFSTASYRQAWQRIAGIADRTGNNKLHATMILMCWTLDRGSGRNWRDYYAGSNVIDELGFDCYNKAIQKNSYGTPSTMLEDVAALAQQEGKPWGVAELGSKLASGDNGSGRAAWLHGVADYARNHDASFVTYFDSTVGGEFRLLDAPSKSAWREEVSAQFR